MIKLLSLNYDAEWSDTVSVKYSDIPNYLKDSAFYKSLSDDDPDSMIEIPAQCFHPGTNIETDYDFCCHLLAFRFWIFETIPTYILDYCSKTEYTVWKDTVRHVLSKEQFGYLSKVFLVEIGWKCNVRLSALPLYFLPYWMAHHPPQNDEKAECTSEAAADGALDLLKFLHLHGYECNAESCNAAAKGGHLECLQFLHESGCPWDKNTCYVAAKYGHFECLKYVHENGCPWDHFTADYLCIKSRDLDIEWLRYVLDEGCSIDEHASANVIASSRFDCLLLLREYNAPLDANTMRGAVEMNDLQIVQYLYEYGCPWDEGVVETATDVAVLTFLLDRGCPYPEDLSVSSRIWQLNSITSNDRLACIQYLIEVQGMYMNEEGLLFKQALLCADLPCIQYLVDQGCPWGISAFKDYEFYINDVNESDSEYDARLLPCLQYAVEHGWKYDRSIINYVCKYRLLQCMEYLVDQPQIQFRILREETIVNILLYLRSN